MTTENTTHILVDVYNASGVKIAQHALPAAIFGVSVKQGLIHQAILAQQANRRPVLASTKTRAEVRGGGRKPWRQKGTGRARQGSIRSPQWRGGGVVFGPTAERVFTQKINRKVKRKALAMALSQKVQQGKLILVETFSPSQPKTKEALTILKSLPLPTKKTGLARVGFVSTTGAVHVNRSLRNLPFVTIVPAHSLNVEDLVSCASLVMPLESVSTLEKVFGLETAAK